MGNRNGLKHCPFCGCEEVDVYERETDGRWYIECQYCGACGWHSFADKEDAVRSWNERYEDERA